MIFYRRKQWHELWKSENVQRHNVWSTLIKHTRFTITSQLEMLRILTLAFSKKKKKEFSRLCHMDFLQNCRILKRYSFPSFILNKTIVCDLDPRIRLNSKSRMPWKRNDKLKQKFQIKIFSKKKKFQINRKEKKKESRYLNWKSLQKLAKRKSLQWKSLVPSD